MRSSRQPWVAKYGHHTGVMRITPGQRLDDRHETLAETLRALRRWAHPWIRMAYRAPTKESTLPDREVLESLLSLGYITGSADPAQ